MQEYGFGRGGGLGFVGFLVGWFGLGGSVTWGGSVVFLILFLKCAVHISAKSAAHINEAAWVL